MIFQTSSVEKFLILEKIAFVELLRRLSIVVENCLIRQAARAARTPAWCLMEPHLRHKIQDAACLVIVPGDERRRARHSSLLRRSEGGNRSNDLQQVKAAITQQTAAGPKKSSSVVATAAVTSKPKSVAAKNEETGPRPKTWPHKLSEVKSRYLEQKPVVKSQPNVKERIGGSVPVTRRTISKSIISSSDSSRTSSPAMKPLTTRPSRSLPTKESNLRQKCQDGISMSTDSLAESTMTKPSISANKALTMKKANTEVKTPLLNRTRRILPNKIDGIKTKSTESLSKPKTTGLQSTLNKDTNKAKSSPLPLNKKSSCQNSPIVGNRFKAPVNSTPSPSLKRTSSSVKNTPEVKSSSLTKRTTYRVQAKPLANQNKANPPKSTTSNQKNYINHRVQNKLNVQTENMSTNNNPPQGINDNKTETKLRPMVGSRSGTFLKDEPTILKKPQVTNVNE
uniref:Uncharacterized protein n=1 Tax=Clastoptera arizonana TaxID=38151 RepID=A0A1B6D470_9HEMI